MSLRVSQDVLEVIVAPTGSVQVSQVIVEAIVPRLTFSPAAPTGVGVSQDVLEVIVAPTGSVRVSQDVIEVISQSLDGVQGSVHGGSGPRTTSYGWAS